MKGVSLAEILAGTIGPEDKRSQEERNYDSDAANHLVFLDINAAMGEMKAFSELLVEKNFKPIQILGLVSSMRSLGENMVSRLKNLELSVIEVCDSDRRAAMKEEALKKFPPREFDGSSEAVEKGGKRSDSCRMTREEIDELAQEGFPTAKGETH